MTGKRALMLGRSYRVGFSDLVDKLIMPRITLVASMNSKLPCRSRKRWFFLSCAMNRWSALDLLLVIKLQHLRAMGPFGRS